MSEPPLKDRICDALALLIREEGLTPSRIENIAPSLIEELGVRSAQEANELIRSTLETLSWPTKARRGSGEEYSELCIDALRNAFGGRGLAKQVRRRRQDYAKAHDLSQQTLSAREVQARRLLADTLAQIAERHRKA